MCAYGTLPLAYQRPKPLATLLPATARNLQQHLPRSLQDKVVELKKKFHGVKRAMYVSRQRFTLPLKEGEKRATALDDERTLASYGLTNGSVLQFKDLGPQVRGRAPVC